MNATNLTTPTTTTDRSDAADVLRALAEVSPNMVVDAIYAAGLTGDDYALPFIRSTFGEDSDVEAVYLEFGCR